MARPNERPVRQSGTSRTGMGGVTVTRTVCIPATEGTNSEDEKLKRRRGNSKLCRQPQRGGRRADNGHVAAQWRQRFVWQTRRHERCIETCAMLFFRFFFPVFFFSGQKEVPQMSLSQFVSVVNLDIHWTLSRPTVDEPPVPHRQSDISVFEPASSPGPPSTRL